MPVESAPRWGTLRGPVGVLRHYASRSRTQDDDPALVLCHELPQTTDAATLAGPMYPTLADRLGAECGLRVVVSLLRGVGGSDGDFSANGWIDDLRFMVDHEVGPDGRALVVGFGLGATVALRLGALESRVCGVAAVGPAFDFMPYAGNPAALVAHCRATGVIADPGFPPDDEAWLTELIDLAPLEAVALFGSKPLLVVRGTEDPEVPQSWALSLVEASGGSAELRVVPGAGHSVRADPRVVATLIGWTERQR